MVYVLRAHLLNHWEGTAMTRGIARPLLSPTPMLCVRKSPTRDLVQKAAAKRKLVVPQHAMSIIRCVGSRRIYVRMQSRTVSRMGCG